MMLIRAERLRDPDRAGERGYNATFLFSDAAGPLFSVDLMGSVMSRPFAAIRPDGAVAWSSRRNRAILPTVWSLLDGDGREAGRLRQRLFRRGLWRAETDEGAEAFTLADARGAVARTFDLPGAPDRPAWAVTRGDTPIGWLARVAPARAAQGRGPLRALARLAQGRDWEMTVAEPAHAPDPRLAALAIVLVHEITERLKSFD